MSAKRSPWMMDAGNAIASYAKKNPPILMTEAANIIAVYAPDDESLAVALEEYIRFRGDYEGYSTSIPVIKALKALKDYRSAHPKPD